MAVVTLSHHLQTEGLTFRATGNGLTLRVSVASSGKWELETNTGSMEGLSQEKVMRKVLPKAPRTLTAAIPSQYCDRFRGTQSFCL